MRRYGWHGHLLVAFSVVMDATMREDDFIMEV